MDSGIRLHTSIAIQNSKNHSQFPAVEIGRGGGEDLAQGQTALPSAGTWRESGGETEAPQREADDPAALSSRWRGARAGPGRREGPTGGSTPAAAFLPGRLTPSLRPRVGCPWEPASQGEGRLELGRALRCSPRGRVSVIPSFGAPPGPEL